MGVGDAGYADVESLSKCPGRVVIRGLLRIVRTPVLIVEQSVGHTGVRLVHADDVTSRGEGLRRGRGRSLVFLRSVGAFGLRVLCVFLLCVGGGICRRVLPPVSSLAS